MTVLGDAVAHGGEGKGGEGKGRGGEGLVLVDPPASFSVFGIRSSVDELSVYELSVDDLLGSHELSVDRVIGRRVIGRRVIGRRVVMVDEISPCVHFGRRNVVDVISSRRIVVIPSHATV